MGESVKNHGVRHVPHVGGRPPNPRRHLQPESYYADLLSLARRRCLCVVHDHLLDQHGLTRLRHRSPWPASGRIRPPLAQTWTFSRSTAPPSSWTTPRWSCRSRFWTTFDVTTVTITTGRDCVQRQLGHNHRPHRDPFNTAQPLSQHQPPVRLQHWRPTNQGKPRRYWIVTEDPADVLGPAEPNPVQFLTTLSPPLTTGIVSSPPFSAASEELYWALTSQPEYDGWARRTNWPRNFHSRPLTAFLWAAAGSTRNVTGVYRVWT
jgi:hypothetical protein